MVGTYLCVASKLCHCTTNVARGVAKETSRGLFPPNDSIFTTVYGRQNGREWTFARRICRTIFYDNYRSSSTSVQHALPRFTRRYKSFVFACFMSDYKFVLVIVTREQSSRMHRPLAVNVNDFSPVPPGRLLFHRDRNGRNATRDKLRAGDITVRNVRDAR